MAERDDRAVINALGAKLEEIADYLEQTMPKLRAARASWSNIAPSVARYAGLEGPSDQFDMSGAEEFGYNRVEAARRRIVEAVRDFEDEVPRH